VSDVSFSVPEGQVLGVIGPNGAGKSTFINLVTGHIKPTEGRVLIDGKDMTGAAPWTISRAGVARTFQIVKPFGGMSVRENVAVGILYEPHGTNVMSKALKAYLPNYGVFDEDRYFAPGYDNFLLRFGDVLVGPTICEDIWVPGPPATGCPASCRWRMRDGWSSPRHSPPVPGCSCLMK